MFIKKEGTGEDGKFKPQSEGVKDGMGFSGRQAEEHEMGGKVSGVTRLRWKE